MDNIERAIHAMDWVDRTVGRVAAWLTLATALICGTVFVLRSWAGFSYLLNAHVRMDIFYARLSARGRAWIDLFGVVFLLMPWLALLAWIYVSYSWATNEVSVQSNGMPAAYVLKALMLGFVALLGQQGLAWIGRCILELAGREPPPTESLTGPLG